MKKIEITTPITLYDSVEELPLDVQDLMMEAVKIRDTAYAPYSKFHVGTAFLLENGEIITGNNQENAAYPSGMCAERVAVWQAGSQFPGVKIKTIVITASSKNKPVKEPIAPCGGCRQALSEYEIKQKENIAIYFMGETGNVIKTESLHDLLPLAFDKSFL
ncbi:cytidine deaminase [Urechidicola vernalis]|uniref:Cytidine deaminase n=1 Tax=Urechidicola vernalis TaxID=3075600 RepID=A0ABU2Y354_9FLAO|nr:cytidine deaminase [Urechidicola sp. P050]MDT0552601.1 cytidine deaminase [Urechidicola sp. P050]